LTSLFGPDSVLPKSPEDMPNYKQTVRSFSPDALNIVYVEYEMTAPSHMPFSATPDKNGFLWIPNAGPANRITRLEPKSGEMKDFLVPAGPTAGVHSTIPASDGSVWVAEQGRNSIGHWDPKTQQITEYHDAYLPGKEGTAQGGERHTLRLDSFGNVWSSGNPLAKFDPETKKFTDVAGVNTYDVKPDKNGNVWFTSPGANKFGKVEIKTMKVTQWESPTPKSGPRRMEIGQDGMLYIGEFTGGKMLRFDPKTEAMKEFVLPGPDPSPYALGVDSEGYIWYDSHHQDTMGRFDPKTGNVVEYPFPQPEPSMREFFLDADNHLWFGTAPNNKVGYFYLTGKNSGTQSVSQK
jgi:virginiamycin B lyase